MSLSFARQLLVTASTKRPPAITSGKRGEPVEWVTELPCTRLTPVSAETQKRLALETPTNIYETFCDASFDVKAGDVLVVDETDYDVRSAAEWPWRVGANSSRLQLVVERAKV